MEASAATRTATPIRTSSGVGLFHRDWGDGPPVVLVASWSLPSDSWAYQMLALSEAGFRCVASDRRGHGRSDDPGRGFGFDTLADDLAAVTEALDLRGATLVGLSMGTGEIVRHLTRHGTGRVARAALVGATTPMLVRAVDNPGGVDPAMFEAFRRDALMRDFPGWIDDSMAAFVTPGTPSGLRNWVRDMALRASAMALLECNRALTIADFRAELRSVALPTLVAHGEPDATCPLDLTGRPTAARLNKDLLAFIKEA